MKPYRNWHNCDLEERIYIETYSLESSKHNKAILHDLVFMAFRDRVWNASQDFDGCTMVQDTTHPDMACFIHDWLFKCRYFDEANFMFGRIMDMQPMKKAQVKRRLLAVKLATWWFKLTNKKASSYSLNDVKRVIDYIK